MAQRYIEESGSGWCDLDGAGWFWKCSLGQFALPSWWCDEGERRGLPSTFKFIKKTRKNPGKWLVCALEVQKPLTCYVLRSPIENRYPLSKHFIKGRILIDGALQSGPGHWGETWMRFGRRIPLHRWGDCTQCLAGPGSVIPNISKRIGAWHVVPEESPRLPKGLMPTEISYCFWTTA